MFYILDDTGRETKICFSSPRMILLLSLSFLSWLDKMEESQREVELKKLRYGESNLTLGKC